LSVFDELPTALIVAVGEQRKKSGFRYLVRSLLKRRPRTALGCFRSRPDCLDQAGVRKGGLVRVRD
jgi:hypothetical protein